MRKLFLLIPALILSLMMNAEVISITTTSPHSSNNLRQALAAANSGDIIEMASGLYVETGDWIAFDDKEVTVRAAESADVVIKPQFSVRVKSGDENQRGKAEFIGVKFDCSALESSQLFVPSDDKANQSIVLKNCELYNWSANKALIQSTSSRRLDAIDIDNCYFHGFEKSIVFVENTNPVNLSITNSTFANVTGVTDSYDAAPIDVRAGSGSVLVDHCTFYNVNSKSLSYGTVTVKTIADPVVSNCIFMLTASADMCATNLKAGGNVKNCLTFNYDNWQPCGHYNTATLTDCFKADPVFKDAANGDYTLRMGSPARGAGMAGSNLGNPSLSAIPEPVETDFASALTLEAADAVHNEYFTLNADYYLKANNPNPATEYGIATWQIHATKEVAIQVTLNNNAASLYGHTYKVEIFDSNNEKKGEVGESGWKDDATPVTLSGLIHLPAAGDYTVKLSNTCNGSGEAILEGITLAYAGGAVIEVPANTLEVADAIYSENGTRADGMISFPSATVTEGWAKWNINVTDEAFYEVALTIKNQYEHNMTISFYEEDGVTLVGAVSEGGNSGSAESTVGHALNLGGIYLKVGNYVAKVTNARSGSDAKIMSVGFTYAGGAVQTMPGTTDINEAWFSSNGTRADGKIDFPNSDIQNGWVKWHVAFASGGNFNVTLNVNSGNCKNYTVALVDENDVDVVTPLTLNDCSTIGTPVALEMGAIEVPAGSYILKVTNATQNSDAELVSVKFEHLGGATINLPADPIPFNEVILSENAYIDGSNHLYFIDSEHKWEIADEWAKWNIHVDGGVYKFTANCYGLDGYSNLTVSVLKGEEVIETYTPPYTYPTGEKTITTPEWFLAEGDYVLKIFNPVNHSYGYLTSISASAKENVLVLNELSEDMEAIVANNGESKKPLIQRTFRMGVYNSICLPFNTNDAELTNIFGAGYELLEMSSAILEGDVLTLNFTTPDLSQNTYGRPYLIKPTKEVKNPLFGTHTIYKSTSHLIVDGGAATLTGVLYKQNLGTHPENLYLGADGNLYFSNSAVTIKGFRAYFHVNVSNPQQVVKHARIVAQGQVVTSIDLVDDAPHKGTLKVLNNGQLIIIKNGVRYNVMGAKIR